MSTQLDLENALFNNINDDTTWQVYADYLQSQGDIRGELINLEYSTIEDNKSLENHAKKLLKQYQKVLLGEPLEQILQMDRVDRVVNFTWKRGFIQGLKIQGNYQWDGIKTNPTAIKILKYFLQSKSCKFMQQLSLGIPSYRSGHTNFSQYTQLLTEHGVLSALEDLYLGDFQYPDDTEISWTTIGNIEPLYSLMPKLRKLHVQGGDITLGNLVHDTLEQLTVETGGLSQDSVNSINNAQLPCLKELKVYFGDSGYDAEGDEEDLDKLLQGNNYPSLQYLGLLNAEFTDDLMDVLVDAKILQQIEILDISLGTLTDEGAEVFIDNNEKFQHLKKINVDDNYLSEDMITSLKNTFENTEIYTEKQSEIRYSDEEGYPYLYVSIGE